MQMVIKVASLRFGNELNCWRLWNEVRGSSLFMSLNSSSVGEIFGTGQSLPSFTWDWLLNASDPLLVPDKCLQHPLAVAEALGCWVSISNYRPSNLNKGKQSFHTLLFVVSHPTVN